MSAADDKLVRALAAQVADRLADRVREGEGSGRSLSREAQRVLGRQLLADVLDRYAGERITQGLPSLTPAEEDELEQAVFDTIFGLGPLDRILADPSVENVFAVGCDNVWIVHADGTKVPGPPVANSDREMVDLIRMAAARLGRTERRFDAATPFLDLRLPDGSRLHAAMAVSDRPVLSVRRHRHTRVDLADLEELGTIERSLRSLLTAAAKSRMNVIVCGGTNAGKTTMLRALLAEIPPLERLVVVEDSAELDLGVDSERHPDVVEFEARQANVEGAGQITMAQLVREGLRMAPDRVIVGEIRGDEVLPMLLAMSQGNDGSLCTVHADSSQGAFARIAMYAAMTSEQFRPEVTNLLISNSIDLVVHLTRRADGLRTVASVREVTGADDNIVLSNEIFEPGPDGRARPASPMTERRLHRLRAHGFDDSLLRNRDGWWDAVQDRRRSA